jgi:rhomboid protease GluP
MSVAVPHMKLERTLLYKKPSDNAGLMSLIGLAVLCVVFALSQQDDFEFSRYLTANFDQVFTQHQFWRLFTSPLMHADIEHLGSNALFFTGLAYLLNGYFGFWVFPVLSFLSGALINLIVLPLYPSDATVVGASGIVYFMAAFWLTLYIALSRELSIPRRLINALALSVVLFVPESLQPHVSYLSHAAGFGLGVAAGSFYFALNRTMLQSHERWKDPEPCPESLYDVWECDEICAS